MRVCWFVAFIVNLIVVAQVTIPNLKTTLQAILPGCFFCDYGRILPCCNISQRNSREDNKIIQYAQCSDINSSMLKCGLW